LLKYIYYINCISKLILISFCLFLFIKPVHADWTNIEAPLVDNDGEYSVKVLVLSADGLYSVPVIRESKNGGAWNTTYGDHNNRLILKVTNRGNGIYKYVGGRDNCPDLDDYSTCTYILGEEIKTIVVRTPSIPTSLSVSPSTSLNSSHTVKWGAASGEVTTYEVDRKRDAGSYLRVYSGLGKVSNFTNLEAGVHTYRVRACAIVSTETSCSEYRYSPSVTVLKPSIPVNISLPSVNNTGSYSITWQNKGDVNVTSNILQQRINSGAWSTIQNDSIATSLFSDKSDGIYDYRVSACNASGCSNYSLVNSVIVANTPEIPESITASPSLSSNGEVTISWKSLLSRTEKYRLEYKKNYGEYSKIYEGISEEKKLEDMPEGVYSYRIKVCNTVSTYTSCSNYKEEAVATILYVPGSPKINVPDKYSSSFEVKWNAGSGTSESYILEERVDGGAWSFIYNGYAFSFRFDNRPKKIYEYRVKACNASGCGSYSGIKKVGSYINRRVLFIHTDILGSPSAETNEKGELVD
jgi:hypothetical protein